MMRSKTTNPYRARFHQTQVRANRTGRVRVNCTIENASGITWTERSCSLEGAAESGAPASVGPVLLGYHVFDARTGLLGMEGGHAGLGGRGESQGLSRGQ